MSYQTMAPPPATSAPVATKVKPSGWWHVLGALLIVAGVGGAIALIAVWAARTSDAVDKFARVRVPPEGTAATLSFRKAGEFTIYYEWRSKADGQTIDNSDHDPPSDLTITLTNSAGQQLPLRPKSGDFTFSFNNIAGRAVYAVDVPQPGEYTMKITGTASEPYAISIGKGVLSTLWPWALGAVGALLLGLGLGLWIITTTGLKRGRAKRARQRESGYGPTGVYDWAPAPAAAPTTAWTPPPSAEPQPWTAPPSAEPQPWTAPPGPASPPGGGSPWGPPGT
jgi:hypothetical protein